MGVLNTLIGINSMIRNDVIVCKDLNGNYCSIAISELLYSMTPITLFGLSMGEISELRRQYFLRGGPEPASIESIRKVFQK